MQHLVSWFCWTVAAFPLMVDADAIDLSLKRLL
jgi:hypothetical protein